MFKIILAPLLWVVLVSSQTVTVTETVASSSTPTVTSLSECHQHDTTQFCMFGTAEFEVRNTQTPLPTAYSDCHSHGSELFCVTPEGLDVEVIPQGSIDGGESSEGAGDSHDDHDGDEHSDNEPEASSGETCHYHGSVLHCTGGNANVSCGKITQEYNIPLRVGLLFVILVTSGLGVFGPLILRSFTRLSMTSWIFIVLKQFGAGVIISTAFVHLYTHAELYFRNPCIGKLHYESTTSAIVMAGLFVAFIIDWASSQLILWHQGKKETSIPTRGKVESAFVNISVMEAGIIFHSILIGLTLVVTPDIDGTFLTFFAVILFHQMFEGIALGSRIASALRLKNSSEETSRSECSGSSETLDSNNQTKGIPRGKAYLLALSFALITPIGMAIGIGVLRKFNGNDPSTVIAIGTLNAFSAGILIWVGVVEMWARDWIGSGAEMSRVSFSKKIVGMFSLIVGLIVMSVLGKWA